MVPVYVDINSITNYIDPFIIEAEITEKTKAIIPVHLNNQMSDMDPILKLQRSITCNIEDAAQAIGSTYKEKQVGEMSSAEKYSFFPTKNLGWNL